MKPIVKIIMGKNVAVLSTDMDVSINKHPLFMSTHYYYKPQK